MSLDTSPLLAPKSALKLPNQVINYNIESEYSNKGERRINK